MHDLITMGRTGVDIYPLDHGVPLEEVRTFEKFLGGSATNVAVAAARYGRSTALITKTGADAFGRYVRAEAERLAARHGCTRWQGTDSSLKFCLVAEGQAQLYPRFGPTSTWDTAAGHAVAVAAGAGDHGARVYRYWIRRKVTTQRSGSALRALIRIGLRSCRFRSFDQRR